MYVVSYPNGDKIYCMNGLLYDALEKSEKKIDKRIWNLINEELIVVWFDPRNEIVELESGSRYYSVPDYAYYYFKERKKTIKFLKKLLDEALSDGMEV